MDKILIKLMSINEVINNYHFVLSFVSNERRIKAKSYKQEKDRFLSLGAGYLLQKYLPNREIKYSDTNKPYVEDGPYFNISHSKDYIVFVMDEKEIGVDIEEIKENKIDAIKYVLNELEKEETDINNLFLMWSNKESLIKCESNGIRDIKDAPSLPLEGKRLFNEEMFYTKSMLFNNYSLSVTRKSDNPFEIEIEEIKIQEKTP